MSKLHRLSVPALLAAPSFGRISPDEEFLLRDWLRTVADAYDEFSVDVPVIGSRGDGSALVSAVDRMWAAITRRRIDLVAVVGSTVDVVEAKLHARMSTVTQVVRYCQAYRVDHPEAFSVLPIVVCRSATPGVEQLLETYNGELVVVPVAAPALAVSE